MMNTTVNNLLNEDEKKMLSDLMNTETYENISHDLVNCQMSHALKHFLINTNDLNLVIRHESFEVRYPIHCNLDEKGKEILDVDDPEITDKCGSMDRYWRAQNTSGIGAFNENNDRALGEVINISLSGVYIQNDIEIVKKIRLNAHLGDLLNFTLRIVNQGEYHVTAKIVRLDDISASKMGIALDFQSLSASIIESEIQSQFEHVLKNHLLLLSPVYRSK